jgi:hypothetical protein
MKPIEKITDHLFTNGAGKKARRLVLEMEDGSNGGGWGREPVRDAIQDHINPLIDAYHYHLENAVAYALHFAFCQQCGEGPFCSDGDQYHEALKSIQTFIEKQSESAA